LPLTLTLSPLKRGEGTGPGAQKRVRATKAVGRIPGTYKVGGRRVPKSTDKDRDSSLGDRKAPGKYPHAPRSAAPVI
jgi:hypothetical protein